MGEFDGEIAKLWLFEFKKNMIGYKEIVFIGNNLGKLEKPQFIPNVFQLINISNKYKDTERRTYSDPQGEALLDLEDSNALRMSTKKTRHKQVMAIRNILGYSSDERAKSSIQAT